MDGDDIGAARVPNELRTQRGSSGRMSELCALDDLSNGPNEVSEEPSSIADVLEDASSPVGSAERDTTAMPPPKPTVTRVGSLPRLGLHVNVPSNPSTPHDERPGSSAKSSILSQESEDADDTQHPPVTPATALTCLPLHAAVAAGDVEAVRAWLDARVPEKHVAAAKTSQASSTPEWPPRPVRDILGPGSESREPWSISIPGNELGTAGNAAARLGEMANARAAGIAPAAAGRDSDRFSPVDVRNEHGNTALAVAAALDDACAASFMTTLLLDRGASPSALSGGWTPLHWAAQQGNNEALSKMAGWEGGRAVDTRASDTGDTPLMVAAAAGRIACCDALLAAGANALVVNADGRGVLAVVGAKVSKGARAKARAATRAALLKREPSLRVLVLHHGDCDKHISTKPHQESPERIAAVLESQARAAATGALPEDETVSCSAFDSATYDQLIRAHSEEYIGIVTTLDEEINPVGTPVAFTPYYQGLKGKKQKKKELSDTFFSPGTMAAALRAAGGVVHAVEQVLRNNARTAFVCVRPPGHHAGTDGATEGAPSSGFSILNNAMIGALHALQGNNGRYAKRVAVVDFDVHHGNGTEEIVRGWHCARRRGRAARCGASPDDQDVFFASIHLADDGKGSGVEFYPGTGTQSDLHDNVVNVVVPPMWRLQENVSDAVGGRKRVPKRNRDDDLDGSGSNLVKKKEKEEIAVVAPKVAAPPLSAGGREEWMRLLRDRILPPLRAFRPDLLIISAGFDGANHDVGNVGVDRRGRRNGGVNLTPEDYEEMTNRLCAVTHSGGGKVVSVLEGGYGHLVTDTNENTTTLQRDNFAQCVVAHVRALAGLGAPVKD